MQAMLGTMDGLRAGTQLGGYGSRTLLVQHALDRSGDHWSVPSKRPSDKRPLHLGDVSVRNTQHGLVGFTAGERI